MIVPNGWTPRNRGSSTNAGLTPFWRSDFPWQNPCLGPIMAGEHSFPLSSRVRRCRNPAIWGVRSNSNCWPASEDPVFPGNGKSKTLPVQTVYLIHFTTQAPSTNEEVWGQMLFVGMISKLAPLRGFVSSSSSQYSDLTLCDRVGTPWSSEHKVQGILSSKTVSFSTFSTLNLLQYFWMENFTTVLNFLKIQFPRPLPPPPLWDSDQNSFENEALPTKTSNPLRV